MKARLVLLATLLLAACAPTPYEQLERAALQTLAASPLQSDTLRGKPLIINYWASWCSPCREEMPELAALQRQHGQNLTILGIALDERSAVQAFLQQTPVNYPVLLGDFAGISALMVEQGNEKRGLPYTVLFDAQGREVARFSGRVHAEQLNALLRSQAAGRDSQAEKQ
ncbi:TlpA family protein disulfide reductase [Chitinilyticum litopenaei]|uniref:TlpA family protein disulfide reductase n=1 Tax=Chitinilyticum litopenaei TaxID=1121276 RepID=UPI000402670A|nr:TlpA disulfide reductase family protein [Chitinilyticum litopenaei]